MAATLPGLPNVTIDKSNPQLTGRVRVYTVTYAVTVANTGARQRGRTR